MNSYISLTYSIGLRVMYARYTSDSRMSAARLSSRTVIVSMAVSPDVQCANERVLTWPTVANAMGFT